MTTSRSSIKDSVKLKPGVAEEAQGQSVPINPNKDKVVPLSRLVQRVSERDPSFLNRITLELLELFAAGKPTPGAGSAAALMGALAGSLTQSVAQYTIKASKRHESYVPFLQRAQTILEEARKRSENLRRAVDEDSAAFDQYWRLQFQDAYIDGASEAEKAKVRESKREALISATDIPIQIAEDCIALAEMGFELYDFGYRDARGETSAAILSAIANAEAAIHTARLNLKSAGVATWADSRKIKLRVLLRSLWGLRKLIEARIYDGDEAA